MIKRIFLIVLVFCANISFAQSGLTTEQQSELKKRVKDKVEEFQGYLKNIVNPQVNMILREENVAAALPLFIGNGEKYMTQDEDGNMISHRAPYMQVSSINRKQKKTIGIAKYLNNLLSNKFGDTEIRMESADVVRVDNIYPIGPNKWECMAYFCQSYVAFKDGKVRYGETPDGRNEVTRKKIKVQITATDLPTGEKVFESKFGDVSVTSTRFEYLNGK